MKDTATGSTVRHTSVGSIKKSIIPLPPLPEQRRIAEVLSDMDGLIGSLEKLLAKKRLIRQGMMQRLLTPQEDWEVKRLGEIAEIVGRIGFRGYTRQDIVKNGYGAISLSPGNIIGNKLSLDSFTSISWKKYDESPEIKVRINDILLVKTGSTFGKTAIVEHLPQKATINPQIVIIKNSIINAKFLSLIISTKRIQDLIMATVVGGAIPTLSQEQIGNFPIYYPKEEARQKEIVASIESMNSSIGGTENLIKKYKFIKQGMMQKLLTGEIRL